MLSSLFIELFLFALGTPVQASEKSRYFLHCSQEENPVLEVTVNYDIENLSKDSYTQYFKEEYSEGAAGSVGGSFSIACGSGGSFSTSFSASIEDKGIQISMDISSAGEKPSSYKREFTIPWSELSYDASDTKAKINAVVNWKKAKPDASTQP